MPCEPFNIDGHHGIICTDRGPRKRCKFCSSWSSFQCDFPVIRRGKHTSCDMHLCTNHRKSIAENVDLCPAHATLYELNGNKMHLGDIDLLPTGHVDEKPLRLPTDAQRMYHVLHPTKGWLSKPGTNGSRAWTADRNHADPVAGGTALDVVVRHRRLKVFLAIQPEMF